MATSGRLTLRTALAAAVFVAFAVGPAPATATFPGANGKLTFTRTVSGFSDVWLMDPDGQNQSLLSGDPATNQRASSFSADGERVVFVTDLPGGRNGIVVMGVDGSNPTLVTDDGGSFPSPHFTPDGQQIVYQTGGVAEDIAIIDVDGQNRHLLTSGAARDFDPSFSPDGTRIVFQRGDGTGINIWTMDADGQNQAPLMSGSPDESSPSFSPDGNRIVFVRAPPGDLPGDIVVMDANGQNQQPLTSTPMVHDGTPVFSPDGSRIAFSQGQSGGGTDSEIVVMDADGQNQVAVTQNGDFDNQVDWQPLNPPQCGLTGESKSKSTKEISVSLLCSGENAAAVAAGDLTAKAPKKRAVASRKKVIPLPATNALVPQGVATVITLAIPKKGRKALKRSGKAGKAALTVTLTDDLGESSTLTHTVKVKPKRKRRK